MTYESSDTFESKLQPGVFFTVKRMSFGRRLELMRKVRDIAPRLECFQAGKTQQDQIEAGLLSAEIDRLYVEWGLERIDGLTIDSNTADPLSLAASGPEELFKEALHCVKSACGLSASETKN